MGGNIIEHKTWNMSETFCFPGYGCPTEIASVQITPQWQAQQLEDSLRLIGIYHVTAHVRFDFQEEHAMVDSDDLVKIDALDLQGDTGYFEYAVPLHVDLPKDASIDSLMVKDIRPSLNNQTCQLEWTIASTFSETEQVIAVAHVVEAPPVPVAEEVVLAVEEQVVLAKESASQIVIRESSSWQQEAPSMIWDLEENYTLLKVRPSNNVVH
ncbi:valyl-tRNA synthetase [Lysinibacillus sp. NPDC097287]|uniref:valyl-tRNA synthetase n=1 Tax=Lysinibacillus sp. NPDC097287 TaxID=3364144 RepID=UPI0037FBBEBA